ncbi:MAG: HEAT repeat domain-containing protein [Chloroflexi bacterium]|nr:HEAT repeat domain-containing protein [Chloroflexota bacterium]
MSLDTLITALQDPEHAPTATSLALLSAMPADDLARFAGAFRSLSIQRRREVIDLLAELAEDNVEFRFDRVFFLGLDDPDVQVRAQSIKALWEYDGDDLARRLIQMLADPEALVRGEAAVALGLYLARAELNDTHAAVTGEIEDALRSVYYDEAQLVEVRGRALEALGIRSEEWVHDLIDDAYGSGDRRLAISAVHAMGRSADPDWLPVLFDEMVSEDAEMRYEAAAAAGEMGDEEAVPQLAELIADEDAEVQEAAIAALGQIGGSAAKSVLQSIATEYEDDRVLDAVTEALATADFLDDPMAFKLYLDRADADHGEDDVREEGEDEE